MPWVHQNILSGIIRFAGDLIPDQNIESDRAILEARSTEGGDARVSVTLRSWRRHFVDEIDDFSALNREAVTAERERCAEIVRSVCSPSFKPAGDSPDDVVMAEWMGRLANHLLGPVRDRILAEIEGEPQETTSPSTASSGDDRLPKKPSPRSWRTE